jgi:hypothetical protein
MAQQLLIEQFQQAIMTPVVFSLLWSETGAWVHG